MPERFNELSGKEWLKFTRTWFVCDSKRYHRNRNTELHPARFPEELVVEFVRFFTCPGETVLDPFAGSGATLLGALEEGRKAIGIELSPRYAQVIEARLRSHLLFDRDHWKVIQGNALEVDKLLDSHEEHVQLDFILTSPPYWNMLRTSRGGVVSAQKKRAKAGLDTVYSDDKQDLGNASDYEQFIEALGRVFDQCAKLLKPDRYLVVVCQNLRTPEGEVRPLAWDLCKRISQAFLFQGEKIWCQNTKPLGIWGWPTTFVPNYHHHYCLVFRNVRRSGGKAGP